MTVTKDDFNKIWASTSSVPTYTFSDTDYQNGWEFVGNLPPTRAMWDEIQRKNDEKMQLLYNGASFWGDSVADLRIANASIGEVYATKGYYTANDGGNGFYVIRADNSDTDDGGSIIILDNGNVAELIPGGIVNVKQFGAKGDDTDETAIFENALAYCQQSGTSVLYIPNGTYRIIRPLYLSFRGQKIIGESTNTTVINVDASITAICVTPTWSAVAMERVEVANLLIQLLHDDSVGVDATLLTYSNIHNLAISVGHDVCSGIRLTSQGLSGYYNYFANNDIIGNRDKTCYGYNNAGIADTTFNRPGNANTIVGGRITACTVGIVDKGIGNCILGCKLEGCLQDIEIGYDVESNPGIGGSTCIVGTYHEKGTRGGNYIKIHNSAAGVKFMPSYTTGGSVSDNGVRSSVMIFGTNLSALPASIGGYLTLGDVTSSGISVKRSSGGYPTIGLDTGSSNYVMQNANGTWRIYNATANKVAVTVDGYGILNSSYGINAGVFASADRPTSGMAQGVMIYDSTLNKPIWYKGSNTWIDAMGNVV